jgi:hypothetical protein
MIFPIEPPFIGDFSSQPRLRTPEGNLLYCFMGMSWGFDIEGGTPWGSEFSLKLMMKHCKYRCFMHLEGLNA